MKLSFKEVLERVFHGVMLCANSENHMHKECSKHLEAIETERNKHDPKSSKYLELERIRGRWADLRTRIHWGERYYGAPAEFKVIGARAFLVKAYVALGLPEKDIGDIEKYQNMGIINPLTFSVEPPQKIKDLENKFEPELSYIDDPALDWQTRWERMFNQHSANMFKACGQGNWTTKVLDRSTATGDTELVIANWELLNEMSRNYLYISRACLAQAEGAFRLVQNPLPEDEEIRDRENTLLRSKYIMTNETSMKCEGGLFAINYHKLPKEWQAKVENPPVKYDKNWNAFAGKP